jgi:hypothetical protein
LDLLVVELVEYLVVGVVMAEEAVVEEGIVVEVRC